MNDIEVLESSFGGITYFSFFLHDRLCQIYYLCNILNVNYENTIELIKQHNGKKILGVFDAYGFYTKDEAEAFLILLKLMR
jgi:hypothetical protein